LSDWSFDTPVAQGTHASANRGGPMAAPGRCSLGLLLRTLLLTPTCERLVLGPVDAVVAQDACTCDRIDGTGPSRAVGRLVERTQLKPRSIKISSKRSCGRNASLVKPAAAANSATVVADSNQIPHRIFNPGEQTFPRDRSSAASNAAGEHASPGRVDHFQQEADGRASALSLQQYSFDRVHQEIS
jgi:hypothetical protein